MRIEVPGVGLVDFPDTMTDDEIVAAIENDILKKPVPQKAESPVKETTSAPKPGRPKLQMDAFGGLTTQPDSRLENLTTQGSDLNGGLRPATDQAARRTPLTESQESRVAEATSTDYGRVVSPKGKTGVPIREELAPVGRQQVERLLAEETDPAKRMVLEEELKRPTAARRPINLTPDEQAYAAQQSGDRTTQDRLADPEVLSAPTGPEATVGSIASGLVNSLGQNAEMTRQGIRSQFADAIGSKAMQQDALAKAARVRNEIADSTPAFDSPTAAAAYAGLSSFVQQVPGLAAAIATGNPVPALAAAGLQTEAEAYTRYRNRGASPTEALTGALGEGVTEVLTEMMPMGVLVNKLGKTGTVNFLTEFMAKEVPGEQLATVVQDALDTAIANPNKTWGEYAKERPGAAWDTLVATAAMGGAVGGINLAASAASRALLRKQEADRAQSMISSAQSVDEALAGFNALSESLSLGAVDVSPAISPTGVPAESTDGGDLVSQRGGIDLPGGGASGAVYAQPDGADPRGVRSDLQTGYVGDAGSQPTAGVEGEDWQAFPESSSLGISRAEMPQIKAEHRGAMVNFLNARGVAHTEEDVDPTSLLPSQMEYSPSKVAKAADSDRAILISKDGRVIDGHHQWLARMQAGEPVRAIRLNATAEELIPQLKEFPSSTQESGASDVGAMEDLVLPAETSAQDRPETRTGVQSLPSAATPLSANSQNTISNSGQTAVQSELSTPEVLPNERSTETATPAGRVLSGTDSGTSASRAGSVRLAQLSALAQRRGIEAGDTDLGAITVSPASTKDLLALPRGTRGSVESVAKAFGQNVVWYKPSEAAKAYVPDGFVVRGKANEADTIYLSVDGSVSPTRTAYHEVLHQLRNDAPDVYDEFSAAIRPLIDEAQAMRVSVQEANRSPDGRDGSQALGDEVYFEELAADIFSDSAHKPEFWLDVADRMPGEVASRFFKLINTLLERVKAALSSDRTFNSDSYVKDLEAARKAAAKAAAQYYIRQKQRGKADLRNAVRTADQTAGVLESPRRKTEELGDFTYSRDKVGGITVFGEPEDIRSLLPDGVIGQVVNGGLAFTPADAPRVQGALAKKAPSKPGRPAKATGIDGVARVEQNGGYGLTSSDIQKLPDAERSAFAESIEAAFRLRGAKGSVLGLSISREFKAKGFTSLIGKQISGPEDLAVASQVYRDPRFETVHYVFIQHGEVVGHRAVSSRMAGFSYVVPSAFKDLESYWAELAEQASELGDGVSIALLHNHPSGDPTPSEADFRLTDAAKRFFGTRSIPLFGHVIINHQKYALIDEDIDGYVRDLDFKDTYGIRNPSAPHALLGKSITSQRDLAEHFKASRVSEGNILLLGANGLSGISLVMEIEPSDLGDAKLAALLRKVSRETGSDSFFAVNVPERMLARAQAAYKKGFFVDVIMQKAYGQENLSLNAVGISRTPGYRMGRTVEVTKEVQQRQNPGIRFSNRRQTDTPEFKRWAGTDNPVIPANEINDTDFSGPGPFVMQAFHGTTHSFSVFDASVKGNKEGQFGAVNYFTSSEQDAADNYAGAGPDLTSRLENLRERLEQDFEGLVDDGYSPDAIASEINQRYEIDLQAQDVPRVDNELDGPVDPYALASVVAQRVLNGGEEIVMEVFVKTERPFVAGDPERSPWFEFFDEAQIETRVLERVADNEGLSPEDIEADRDSYEDALQDARFEIMDEQENPLITAVQTVADRYDFDPSGVLASLYDVTADGTVRHNKLEDELRYLLDRKYVEDPETGDLISNHVLAEVIQELGFDSIILKNADRRFRNMNMGPGTAHIHVFDANNTNIKSATDNNGQFDPKNPDIRYSNRRETLPETITVNGVERPKTNSNGQPIHPTLEGIKNFWGWFGDSKVVDAEGRPLVVYHGSRGDFNAFNIKYARGEGSYGKGFYFADTKGEAEKYGGNVFEVYLRIDKPAAIKDVLSVASDTRKLQRKGFDGVAAVSTLLGKTIFVAFNPNQIKSAIGNTGDFSAENPDIRYSNRRQYQLGDQLSWQEFKQYLQSVPARDSFGKVSAAEKSNWAAAAESWVLKALNPKTLEPATAETVDVSEPIIVGTDGDVIDGRNRLTKAVNKKAPAIAAWVGSDEAVSSYTPDAGLVDIFKSLKADMRIVPKSVRNKVEAHPLAAEIKNVQDNFLDILEQLETDGLVKINC